MVVAEVGDQAGERLHRVDVDALDQGRPRARRPPARRATYSPALALWATGRMPLTRRTEPSRVWRKPDGRRILLYRPRIQSTWAKDTQLAGNPPERNTDESRFDRAAFWHTLGRCRYIGLLRYGIQAHLTALALNLKRIVTLLTGVRFRPGNRQLQVVGAESTGFGAPSNRKNWPAWASADA